MYVGGDLYVLDDVVYDEVSGRNLVISGVATFSDTVHVGTAITIRNSGPFVTGLSTFVGLSTFTDVWVGGGLTVGENLTVSGNLDVTGDITYDEVTGRNLNITGVSTLAQANITTLNVASASTFVGLSTFTDIWVGGAGTVTGDLSVTGDLNVTGDISYDEVTGRNLNITGVATITRLNTTNLVGTISTLTRINTTDIVGTSATFTTINATTFVGAAAIGVASESTYVGAGASILDFTSSNGTAWNITPAGTSGIATVNITPGVSIGLAIALGG